MSTTGPERKLPRPVEKVARPQPKLVEEVAKAIAASYGFRFEAFTGPSRKKYLTYAEAVIVRLRDLGCFNERAFDLLRSEGQYEATQPERYRKLKPEKTE
jgi:hypothetical protein